LKNIKNINRNVKEMRGWETN